MTENEKLRQTLERASAAFEKLPQWEREEWRGGAAIHRTVQPVNRMEDSMFNLNDEPNPITYLNPDETSDKAQNYAEFDVLTENDFEYLAQDAIELRHKKDEILAKIKDNDLAIMSLMAALPVKSVTYAESLFTFVDSGSAKTLDKKTLKANLVRYGVPVDAINGMFEASMKTSQRAASIRVKTGKGGEEGTE